MTTVNEPVSTSEYLKFAGKCEVDWLYSSHPGYKLAPISDGPSASWGTEFHKGMEYYYKKLMEGVEHDVVAKDVVNRFTMASFEAIQRADPAKSKMYADIAVRAKEYFEFYKDDILNWEILGVEEKIQDGDLIGRIDLIIRYRRGPFRGCIVPVDHKTLYNFWNSKAMDTAPQPRSYVRLVRSKYPDAQVPHMLMNFVRFRMDAVDKFLRQPIEPTRMEIARYSKNHSKITKRINELKGMSREKAYEEVVHSLVKTTCEYCLFEKLCTPHMNGTNTTNIEMVEFKPNKYGYSEEENE